MRHAQALGQEKFQLGARPLLSSRAASAALLPPTPRPNHATRFVGIPKKKPQAFRGSDPETLRSQLTKTAGKRLSLSGLEVLHGRLLRRRSPIYAAPHWAIRATSE